MLTQHRGVRRDGELLEQSGAPHGVIVEGDTDRYSMAYFHSPNVTRPIKVAPSCVDDEHPAKYEPTLYADLIREFYQANYFHQDGYGKAEIRNRYD